MANQGLNNYTKQIGEEIGNVAEALVNVNKTNANLHILMPLITTNTKGSIHIGLVYNQQDKDKKGIFGKGIKANYEIGIEASGSNYRVVSPDGSIDEYIYDGMAKEYKNKEKEMSIKKEIEYIPYEEDRTIYTLKDKMGTSLIYEDEMKCPKMIKLSDGEEIEYHLYGPIKNQHKAQINFEISGNLVRKLSYVQNGILQESVELSYENERLAEVKTYKESMLIKHMKINYQPSIKISDEIAKESLEYWLENDKVISYQRGSSDKEKVNIEYQDHYSIISKQEEKEYVFFDTEGMVLYEMNEEKEITTREYNKETKNVIFASTVMPTKNTLPCIFKGALNDFNRLETGLSSVHTNDVPELFRDVVCPVFRVAGSARVNHDITLEGKAGEKYSLVLWGRLLKGYSEEENVKVSMYIDGVESKAETYFTKREVDGLFEAKVIGFTALKSFKRLTITIQLKKSSIEIGGIQVLKKEYGMSYGYDEYGNVIEKEGMGQASHTFYTSDHKVSSGIDGFYRSYKLKYNEKGYMTRNYKTYGVEERIIYDENNSITNQIITDVNQTNILETKETHDADTDALISYTNANQKETKYTYDSYGRIKKINDILGKITEYSYKAFGSLENLYYDQKLMVKYSYNSEQRLEKAELENGSIYEFSYDTKGNILSVKLNNEVITKYAYDELGQITQVRYGENSDTYTFSYTAKQELESITFLKYNAYNGSYTKQTKYILEYDKFHRLSKIKDESNRILASYTYDNDGRIESVKEGNTEVQYQWVTNDTIGSKTKNIKQFTYYEVVDGKEKSKAHHPETIEKLLQCNTSYMGTMFHLEGSVKNKEHIIPDLKPSSGARAYIHKGVIPCVKVNYYAPLSYTLPIATQTEDCGCIGFWFYPETIEKNQHLFSLKSTTSKSQIRVYLAEQGKLELNVVDIEGGNHTLIVTDTSVIKNQWNFFCLDWINRTDEGSPSTLEFLLQLNSERKIYQERPQVFTLKQEQNAIYMIGALNGGNQTNAIEAYITALMIGTRKYVRLSEVEEYYKMTRDYIKANEALVDGQDVDYSITTAYTNTDGFEVYPLHSQTTTLNGKNPIALDFKSTISPNPNSSFRYCRDRNCYAYVADGAKLEYMVDMAMTGTILLRTFIEETRDIQYLLDCVDSYGQSIALYRGPSNYLYIAINGTVYKTTLVMKNQEWHTVGISFYETEDSDSISTNIYKQVRVYLNGTEYTNRVRIDSNFEDLTATIGRSRVGTTKAYALGSYEEVYPLYGLIELLITKSTYCEMSSLNTIQDKIQRQSKSLSYDTSGLLKKEEIHNKNHRIYKKEINYETRAANSSDQIQKPHLTGRIKSETITYGNNSSIRSYSYDTVGNIIGIQDSVFGSHSYKYDSRGFLIQDDTVEYEYDSNGNINWKGVSGTTYDKDKLSFNMDYDPNTPLNPIRRFSNQYRYDGKQLVWVNYGEKTVSLTYNAQGLRTSKQIDIIPIDEELDEEHYTYQYQYEEDRLICEEGKEGRFDYLYDENNKLYGFIRNKTKKYYYVKDILENIIGILDEAGELVVKYDYRAYGILNKLEGDRELAFANKFRYKSYYYDAELDMYYCKSRYYVPAWCRWLNGDQIDYLDFTNINMLNLFTYCGNNPVNYKQRPVSSGGSVVSSSISSISNGGIYSSGSVSSGSVGSSRVNWENGGVQIPIWISSLMSGSDFGASIAPALRTIYQYIRYPGVKDLNKLYGLDFVPGKLNTVCSVIGYGLLGINIGLSAWSNFTNYNLTTKQQWISFGVDTAYTLGTFGIGYGVGVLVSLIPGAGVFIAPFVSAGVTWLIDWTNEKWGWLDDVKQWFNDL